MSIETRTPSTRVRPLRALSLVLAVTAAVGLIFGTAGFTAMDADRGLAVNVTDDESAYLGYSPLTDTVRDGESTDVVEYRNRFGGDLTEFDVTVSIADPDSEASLTGDGSPGSIPRWTAGRVAVTLACDAERDVDLLFEATASGAGASVSLDRTHTVTCVPTGPTVSGVQYSGVGTAHVETGASVESVEAIVWLTDANPETGGPEGTIRSVTVSSLNTSQSVRPQLPSDASSENIAAIEFPERAVAFFHPGWNGEKHADPNGGAGIDAGSVPLDSGAVANTSVVDGSDAPGDSD